MDSAEAVEKPVNRNFPFDAERSAEPMPFDCEHIVDSSFGRLITMEE
jgi:hypothetical protein